MPSLSRYLLLAALAGATLRAAAQPTSLRGTLPNCPEASGLTVNEPVGAPGYVNLFFAEPANEIRVQSGAFAYTLRNEQAAGFVRLQSKCVPAVLVYVEPGAQLTLSSTADPAYPGGVRFGGSNAAANNLLANRQLLNNGPADQQRIVRILTTAASARQARQQLQDTLARYTAQLQALHRAQQISARCLADLQAETEQRLLFWVYMPLIGHFTDAAKAALNARMPDAELRRLLRQLTADYDPVRPQYQRSSLNNGAQLAVLRQLQALPGRAPASRTWAGYAPLFKDINGGFAALDYAPAPQQEQLLGTNLLNALTFRVMNSADFAGVFTDYVRHFPASPYVPLLTRGLAAEAPAAATAPDAGPTLGYFADPTQGLMFGSGAGVTEVKTLEELVQRQFAGTPVFVDFWASWCAPCLAEFRHEPELYAFLRQQGISILYVAIDKPGLRARWQELVARNQLHGYHYLASPTVQAALSPQVPYLPRYMLFGKDGRLLLADARPPSSGPQLHQQLQAALAHP